MEYRQEGCEEVLNQILKTREEMRETMRKLESEVRRVQTQGNYSSELGEKLEKLERELKIVAEFAKITAEKIKEREGPEDPGIDPVREDLYSAMEDYIEIHRNADLRRTDARLAKHFRRGQ